MSKVASKSNRLSIKICGISNTRDAQFAYASGADAIGMIFHPPSPRNISFEAGAKIVKSVSPLCNTVAVTVNMAREALDSLLEQVAVNTLQFHGNETATECEQFGMPYFKAIRMKPGIDLQQEIDRYPNARGILLDTYVSGVVGGTGKTFDWSSLKDIDDSRVIVAGGLNPDTILTAIEQSQAHVFDLASGVESSPGQKDHQKITKLFEKLAI